MEGGEVDDKEGEGDVGHFREGEVGPSGILGGMEEAVEAEVGEKGEGLPGDPGGEEEGEGGNEGAQFSAVDSAEGIRDEDGDECAGECAEGIAEDIAKVGDAGGNGELERFEGKREEDEAANDEEEGPELGIGFLEGPLADEGGGQIEGEIDDDVLPVIGPGDAVPGERTGEVQGASEVPGEE